LRALYPDIEVESEASGGLVAYSEAGVEVAPLTLQALKRLMAADRPAGPRFRFNRSGLPFNQHKLPSRPDTPAERRAETLLAPLLDKATDRLVRLRAAQTSFGSRSHILQTALNKAAGQVLAELATRLRRAGIEGQVQPYSRAEIKQLLRGGFGRARTGAAISGSAPHRRRVSSRG
jgi:hypothetical protein